MCELMLYDVRRDVDSVTHSTGPRVTRLSICSCGECQGVGTNNFGVFRQSYECTDSSVKGISGTTAVGLDGIQYLATVELTCTGD